ncbi:MAG: alpha/beta hydrolase [Nitrospinae bacterium]|nr:alpha/beta hydrolase [Nitrospinota bacterium]
MRSEGGWYAGFETVSNFQLFFRDWRPAKKSSLLPLIALHGSLIQSGMWNATAEGAGSIRMICPDQRGFGRTDDPGTGDAAADFARDVIGLADVLLLDRFVVMGHSFAASIALAVAAERPDRVAASVLVDPTMRDASGANANMEASRSRPMDFEDLEQAQKFFTESEEGNWPPARTKRFLSDVLVRDGAYGVCRVPYEKSRILRLREFQASSASDYDPVFWAKRTICPSLVFRGGESKRFSEKSEKLLMSVLPMKSRVVVCEKAGHFPSVTEPTTVQRELKSFLADLK